MVRRRSLANRAELSRNHLSLPFRIKRDAEDGFALITQELQYGHRSLGSFIASSQGFDDDVGSSFALRTPADHTWLLFGMLEDIVVFAEECFRGVSCCLMTDPPIASWLHALSSLALLPWRALLFDRAAGSAAPTVDFGRRRAQKYPIASVPERGLAAGISRSGVGDGRTG
jgi:hypothetical protein